MKLYKILILSLIFNINVKAQSTIYSFQIDSIANGGVIDFNAFAGKKILIVNTASVDSSFSQYEELKQLNLLFKDSLVIVAIPSNSFDSEPGDSSVLGLAYQQDADNVFPVATKMQVAGAGISPLYTWLINQSQNGVMDSEVKAPFQKYLINKKGKLVGVFSKRMKPLSNAILDAILDSMQ